MSMEKFYKSTTINGKEFGIYVLPARKGLPIAIQIAKAVGPALARLADTAGLGHVIYSDAAHELVSKLDSNEVMGIVETVLNGATCNKTAIDFDTFFMANYGEFVELIAFALKENFGSFFEANVLKSLNSTFKAQ